MGMHIIDMDAKSHDVHAAYISHISHITSFALANTVLEKEKEEKQDENNDADDGSDEEAEEEVKPEPVEIKKTKRIWIPLGKVTQGKYL